MRVRDLTPELYASRYSKPAKAVKKVTALEKMDEKNTAKKKGNPTRTKRA